MKFTLVISHFFSGLDQELRFTKPQKCFFGGQKWMNWAYIGLRLDFDCFILGHYGIIEEIAGLGIVKHIM